MKIEFEGLEEYTYELAKEYLRKYRIWKFPATMVYTDSGFKKLRPSTADWPCNWVNTYKKQV